VALRRQCGRGNDVRVKRNGLFHFSGHSDLFLCWDVPGGGIVTLTQCREGDGASYAPSVDPGLGGGCGGGCAGAGGGGGGAGLFAGAGNL